MWRPRSGWSLGPALAKPAFWPVDALVLVAVGVALVHAWDVVGAARGGVTDDDTWGLMHLPMQTGFALATPVAAAVAVLALANRVAGWWGIAVIVASWATGFRVTRAGFGGED